MMVGFLPITFCRSTRSATIAFSFSALLSLVVNTTPLLFADKMCRKCCATPGGVGHGHDEELVEDCHRHRIRCLCIAVFASNVLLMVTAACLTAVLNVIYLYLAAAVVFLVVAPYACHIEASTRNTVTWGIVQYEEFQDDIRYFFDLSSEATQAAFLGLPATLFSQLRRTECRRSVGVRAPEVLTMYTVLFGLFIMLVCSVPLAADFKETREKFVRVFIRYSTYALLALLSAVAFLAAIEVLQAYIVLAFVLVLGAFLGGLFWHVNRAPQPPGTGRRTGEGDTAGVVARRRRSLVWFGFCPAMFGALMASYSRSVSGEGPGFSKLYRACVFFIFVSLIANLTRMLLVHEVHDEDGEAPLLLISGLVNVFLMALTVLLVVLVALLQPQQIQNTFVLA
ncbi:hypothetical protein D1007_12994 [Hordeum vulgare]|nr:hypothetical protein D1007_12994 [Hordeum vulgare]